MVQQSQRSRIVPAGGDTSKPLNLAKRINLIREYAGPLEGKHILDAGCGAGEYVKSLHEHAAYVRGIEYDPEKVTSFRSSHPDLADLITTGDIAESDYADESFDVIVLNEVLEHVPDDRRCLSEMYRILRDDGMLIVFSPNRLYPFETHGVFWKGTSRKVPHYAPFVPYIPLGVGQRFFDYWARNYSPWDLGRRIREAGFEISDRNYVWQTFENISGFQPAAIRLCRPILRRISSICESVHCVRCFGVSQLIIAKKRP